MPDLVNPDVQVPTEQTDGTLWEVFFLFAELRLIDSPRSAWIESAASLVEFEMYLGRRPLPSDLTDENMGGFVRWYIGNPDVPTRPATKRTALLRTDRLLTLWKFAANVRYTAHLPGIKGRPRHYAGEQAAWLKDSLWQEGGD